MFDNATSYFLHAFLTESEKREWNIVIFFHDLFHYNHIERSELFTRKCLPVLKWFLQWYRVVFIKELMTIIIVGNFIAMKYFFIGQSSNTFPQRSSIRFSDNLPHLEGQYLLEAFIANVKDECKNSIIYLLYLSTNNVNITVE